MISLSFKKKEQKIFLLILFVCGCVIYGWRGWGVFSWAYECRHRGQGWSLGVFLYRFLCYSFEIGSLLEPEAHEFSWLADQQALRLHLSLGLQACTAVYVDARDLNSGPPAHTSALNH